MKILKYLLILLCFVPLLFFRDFTPNNELRYLSIVDEALRDGHFFAFWNHGMVYADKPPLYLWCIMLGKWLLGEHYMLFIGLFSIIPALIILAIMDKWIQKACPVPNRHSAQLMLVTSGLFTGAAIVLRMDMLMSMFIILALYTFYKLYTQTHSRYDSILLPIYIFLAIFSKGPIGLVVPLLSIFIFLLMKGQIREFGKYLGGKQWGILLGLCILWFSSVYLEGGYTYLHNLLFKQTVNRAVNAFDHKEPFWYYLKTIWYALVPWSLFYIVVIIWGIKKHLLNSDLKKFFLTTIVSTFIALSLFSGKLDIYLLPIYPFIAYLAFLFAQDGNNRLIRFTIALPAFILFLSLPGALIAGKYIPIDLPQAILIPATTILSLFSLLTLYLLWKKQLFRATNSLAIGLLFTICIGSFALPQLNQYLGFRKLTEEAQALARQNGISEFYFFNFRSGENMDVYLKKEIKKLDLDQIRQLEDKQSFILFIRNKDLKRNEELPQVINGRQSYVIGDYSIIIF